MSGTKLNEFNVFKNQKYKQYICKQGKILLYKPEYAAIIATSSPAQVAKLVDAGDSKSPAARCVGSSPTLGTTKNRLSAVIFFACRKLILETNILINQDFCWFCHVLGIGSNQTRGSAKVGFISLLFLRLCWINTAKPVL